MGHYFSSNKESDFKKNKSTYKSYVPQEYKLKKIIPRIKSAPALLNTQNTQITQPTYNFSDYQQKVTKIKSEPNICRYTNPVDIPIDYKTRVRNYDKYGISILNNL
jgi:hypothetical protein